MMIVMVVIAAAAAAVPAAAAVVTIDGIRTRLRTGKIVVLRRLFDVIEVITIVPAAIIVAVPVNFLLFHLVGGQGLVDVVQIVTTNYRRTQMNIKYMKMVSRREKKPEALK